MRTCMNLRILLLLSAFFGLASNFLVAQVRISGTISDSSHPLVLAKLDILAASDSALVFSGSTDSLGQFSMTIDSSRNLLLRIQAPGYPVRIKTIPPLLHDTTLAIVLMDELNPSGPGGTNANAQTVIVADTTAPMRVSGILLDKADRTPIRGATVTIKRKKARAALGNTISDNRGYFVFNDLPRDTFIIAFSSIGYELVDQQINPSPSIDLGNVLVPKTSKQLQDVVVTAKTPPAQQKADTIQYNANAFKVNPDASSEDLVKKMPGITVDKDGTVTAHGDQVKKVTIDGKDFMGDDATAALRNLPAEVVDKIQVFDRLSDQAAFTGFDDGNSVKAINIVTKSNFKNGQFGRLFAGYGTDDRYSAGGNVSFFKNNRRVSLVGNFNNINQQNFASQDLLGVSSNGGGGNFGGRGGRGGGGRGGGGGFNSNNASNFTVNQQNGISKTNAIGINYTDKWNPKLDVQASYFFNNSSNINERELHSQTLVGAQTQFADQNSVSNSNNNNHRFNLRLEYKLDSNNSFIINPSLNFQNNHTISTAASQTYYGVNDTSSTSQSSTDARRNGYNLRNNILYRHNFGKRGRTLSVNFNTTFNENNGETYALQELRFFDKGIVTDSALNQYSNNPTSGYSISGNVAYTEPIGKKGQLQINYSPSWTKNKADQQTFLYDSLSKSFSQFSELLSNKFDNSVTTNNGGISYRLGTSRDNQFSVGVNLQHSLLQSMRIFPTSTSVNQSFTNVLPNLRFSRKISVRSSINLFYRAGTDFPSVTQLQDVVNLSNQLRVTSGNPDLKQAYTHFLSARYTFTNTQKGQSLFANVFLQSQSNYISSATYIASADSLIQQGIVLKSGSQLIKPVNVDGYKSLRSFLTFSQPITLIKSNVNLSTGFTYSRLPGLINYQQTVTNNYVYNAGVVIASNISQYIDFNISYNAAFNNTSSSVAGQSNQRYVNQSAGVQFNLLSKKGWFLNNDLSNQRYSGLSGGLDQNFWLWNAAIGKKFLKKQAGELKLSVFDLLKQNQSIVRTVSENYIEDSRTNVLRQYFMLTFSYSLRNFGTGKTQAPARGQRRPNNF